MPITVPKVKISVRAETRAARRYEKLVRRSALSAVSALPKKAWLRKAEAYELAVTLASPKQIQRLNKQFRKKDKPTDVLSFPLWQAHPTQASVHMGDICLCPSVARTYAKEQGHSLEQELKVLTVHGILHLCGYDHEADDAEAQRMFRLQERIVAML
ncbi:MAG: rRNA maturation RNase YbeY [Bdellovibrionales bacterium]|nr:rRNA maturation RNase YbeY [Bdellovibrionales bacterium]